MSIIGQVQIPEAPTVADILDRFTREYVPTLGLRTQVGYLQHIRVLRKEFGHRIAREMLPKDFGPFLDVRKGRIQRNRQLAVLSCAFSEAVKRWYWLERNVLKDVARNPSKPRDRYVTNAEYEAVRAMASSRLKLAMELALLTGQRQGDIISLKWSQVQVLNGADVVLFEQAKTKKRLAVLVTPALETALDKCWQLPNGGKYGGEYVITRRCGGRYTSEGFRACWQRTMQKYERLGNKRFNFHDIRAKSASDSTTVEAAYERLGHTSMAMTKRVYDRGIRVVRPLK